MPQRAAIGVVASLLIAFGVFLSGFVINEPAPYELYMAGLIGLWAILGLRLSRHIAPLIVLYVTFNIGGMFKRGEGVAQRGRHAGDRPEVHDRVGAGSQPVHQLGLPDVALVHTGR